MQKMYRIKLSSDERAALEELTRSGRKVAAKKVIKARSLLLADESGAGPALGDGPIMEATGIKPATLARLRQRACEDGPLEALQRKAQAAPSQAKFVDGRVEAEITRIACSEAPDGRNCWTLRMIAGKLVELEVLGSISHETVREAMKKKTSSRG